MLQRPTQFLWCSGYHIRLTRGRSQVRYLAETEYILLLEYFGIVLVKSSRNVINEIILQVKDAVVNSSSSAVIVWARIMGKFYNIFIELASQYFIYIRSDVPEWQLDVTLVSCFLFRAHYLIKLRICAQ